MPCRRDKVYHVMPAAEGGWQVKDEQEERATSTHEKKDEAVARAKELAKGQALGQVIIHKKDGTIQTEYTYVKDPSPPSGSRGDSLRVYARG